MQWLWPGRIALGKLTLIVGDPGLGKSFATLDIASRLSVGASWPDGTGIAPIGSTIIMSAEDEADDTIRPRLDAAGADVSKTVVLDGMTGWDAEGEYVRQISLACDLAMVEQTIDALGDCRLIIVDPVTAYMGKTDDHKNAEVRAVLTPLTALASRRGVAIVAITHMTKGQAQAIYRANGSLAYVAAARAAWVVTKDPAEENRRLFLPLKNNLSVNQGGLAFKVAGEKHGHVEWMSGAVSMTADDAISAPAGRPGPNPNQLNDAVKWLRMALSEGPRPSTEIDAEAVELLISVATLRRARKALGVESYRPASQNGWWLRLQDAHAAGDEQHDPLEHLERLEGVQDF